MSSRLNLDELLVPPFM